jgi:hypothetical protein
MPRLNISIPDPLYERLDRRRDRINASSVCATALEMELDRIEGQSIATPVEEAKVAQLVERLRRQHSDRERWLGGRSTTPCVVTGASSEPISAAGRWPGASCGWQLGHGSADAPTSTRPVPPSPARAASRPA